MSSILNAHDFEEVAERTLSKKTWAFYSSAATDCITRDRNATFFSRIWFRPRALRNVSKVDTRSRMLGHDIDLPLFISPAAMAKLVDPEGEKAMAAGCVKTRIPQCISTNASFPAEDIVAAAPKDHPFFFQLYVNKDRPKTEALLHRIWDLGVRTIFVTVDAPVPGKREADERVKADEGLSSAVSGAKAGNDAKGGGLGRIMGSYIDDSLSWDDLPWLRKHFKGKIVIKGIQSAMDAKACADAGLDGVLLSNHGGRSLDTAPPAIMVLVECQRVCPEIFDKIEVYVDSGIRRGTDLVKCLCLGATAVGMGRSFLFSLNYGKEGIEHLIESKLLITCHFEDDELTPTSHARRGRGDHEDARSDRHFTAAPGPCQHARCGRTRIENSTPPIRPATEDESGQIVDIDMYDAHVSAENVRKSILIITCATFHREFHPILMSKTPAGGNSTNARPFGAGAEAPSHDRRPRDLTRDTVRHDNYDLRLTL